MNKPLVSIVTPTHYRHDSLINRTIPSVSKQTYPNIEHIIVSDGPDPELAQILDTPNFYQLGRNWGGFIRGEGTIGVGATPRNIGTYLAKGDFICCVDDDDELLPNHVELLINAIETNQVDFAFSKIAQMRHGTTASVVGNGSLEYGHIGSCAIMYKATCFKQAEWPRTQGYDEDYQFAKRLTEAGYTYYFVDTVTAQVYPSIWR